MSDVGQIERRTQARIVKLFREKLHYDYLGDLSENADNRNIEVKHLEAYLKGRGYDPALIKRAIAELVRVATDQSRSLYDIHR